MTEREMQEELKNDGVIRKHVKIVNDIRGKMVILKRYDDWYGPMIGHWRKNVLKKNIVMNMW